MTNKAVVKLLEEIALLLDLSGDSPFKARAYTNVARQIDRLEDDVCSLVAQHRLREIKGVGDALEQKIEEFVNTGELQYYQKLRSKFPESLFELFGIPGLGPKRIKQIYAQLNIQSLAQLEAACVDGSLSAIKGFGPKIQQKLIEGIEFAREHQNQHHYDRAFTEAKRLRNILSEDPSVIRIEVAGSLRRCKEVVKDIDIIASSSDAKSLMRRFVEDVEVERITGQGTTKSGVVLRSGIAVDLRVVNDEQFPYALAHFTGSREHNVVMRQRAKERGFKLNEYGLFDSDTLIACDDEKAIFERLELPYIPPELREDRGEFDVASIPTLITQGDLVGLTHCHSTYSDGQDSIREMAHVAIDHGYAYMTITDHSQSAAYAGGLTVDGINAQHAEIDELNPKLNGFRVLKGIESDIRTDGSLDYEAKILDTFEFVIVSVHSKLDMTEEEATRRVIRAVEDPHTTVLAHPTSRLLLKRKGFPLNFDKVFDACAANHVAIEINANCQRLDLDWRHVRRAKERGAKLSIGPDAHMARSIADAIYGIGIARKGWLEADDVINTMTLEQLQSWQKG